MNRRRFLGEMERVSLGIVAASAALPLVACGGRSYVRGIVTDNRLHVPAALLEPGVHHLLVEAPNQRWPLLVVRHDDGRLTTVSTRCMHRGCQVDPVADRLICPCHGSEYTREGAVLKGPTRAPLHRFATRMEGEEIVIDLNRLEGV